MQIYMYICVCSNYLIICIDCCQFMSSDDAITLAFSWWWCHRMAVNTMFYIHEGPTSLQHLILCLYN